jgi:hypothetical protein
MSLSGSRALLTDATRELLARWDLTKSTWRDRKAAEFEERWLGDLGESVNHTLRVIEELDQLLGRIHADCE